MAQVEYARAAQPAVSPESLGGVIVQTQNHLQEAENRLSDLINRIDPHPRPSELTGAKIEVVGMLSSANAVRNTASRILDLISQLENVI